MLTHACTSNTQQHKYKCAEHRPAMSSFHANVSHSPLPPPVRSQLRRWCYPPPPWSWLSAGWAVPAQSPQKSVYACAGGGSSCLSELPVLFLPLPIGYVDLCVDTLWQTGHTLLCGSLRRMLFRLACMVVKYGVLVFCRQAGSYLACCLRFICISWRAR